MAYYDVINLVAGDSKPEINLTLKDSNTAAPSLTLDPDDSTTWAAIDITTATPKLKFRALGSTTILATLTCVKVSPFTNGTCNIVWGATTLDVPAGTYEGEIELTYSDGTIMTLFDRLKFKVRAEF